MSQASMEAVEGRAQRALSSADYHRFLPLVRRTAMRLARRVPSQITVQDLVSYGWVGLIEAYRRADPTMPPQEFEAYAGYRIKGAMLDFLRSLDPATRSLRGVSRKVTRTIAELSQSLSRAPEEAEIAEALGMSLDAYRAVLGKMAEQGLARLELLDLDQVELDNGAERADDAVGRQRLGEAIANAIEDLPERLQQILALYYQEECTLKEIGAVLGVSESRVCQLHSEAMHRLRAAVGRE